MDHNFSTNTYNINTSVFNECKTYIANVAISSEPASKFNMNIWFEVNAINAALGDVLQIFEEQAYTYQNANKNVCAVDGEYALKLIDSVQDVERLKSTIDAMADLMKAECTTNSFVGFLDSDVGSLLANGIAAIQLSDYVTIDENGKSVYNKNAIDNFFKKFQSSKNVSQKEMVIIESLLYSTINNNTIDEESLEMILNSSLLAINSSNRESFLKIWKQVSYEMNSYTECLMLQNMEILTGRKKNLSNEENELKCKLKSIIMLNDVVKVMNSRASSIQLNKIDGDNVLLNYYSKNGLDRLVTDYIPKYGISGIFNAKEIKDYSDNQTEKLQKAVDAGKITIKFHKDKEDSIIPYLEFGVGSSNVAFIQEFTSASNTSLNELKDHITAASAESYLKSFINKDVEGISEDEYLSISKNSTFNDKIDTTLSYAESIPYLCDAVSLTKTVINAGLAATDAMLITDMSDEQESNFRNSTLDMVSEVGGKIPYAGPAIKTGSKIIKTKYSNDDEQEQIKKEYREKIQENEKINKRIENIKSGEYKDLIKAMAISNGAGKEETQGAARYSFSVIYYADTQEFNTSTMLDND